jgi:hypothetical protein
VFKEILKIVLTFILIIIIDQCGVLQKNEPSSPNLFLEGRWNINRQVLSGDTVVVRGKDIVTGRRLSYLYFIERQDSIYLIYTCDRKYRSRYTCPLLISSCKIVNPKLIEFRLSDESGSGTGRFLVLHRDSLIFDRTLELYNKRIIRVTEVLVR